MKPSLLLPLFALSLAAGCSSGTDNAAPGPDAGSTSQQQVEKIKNDPEMPEGLKKIKIDTLESQPGGKP
ncbi:hypothetical protein EON79_05595 [bacterium]|nr:MAG: hypothetical protein EON79_05595 [bacterium]